MDLEIAKSTRQQVFWEDVTNLSFTQGGWEQHFRQELPLYPLGDFAWSTLTTKGGAEPVRQREDLTRRLGNKPGSRRTLAGVIPKSGSALQEGALSARLGQCGFTGVETPGGSQSSHLGKDGFSSQKQG